MQSNAHTIFFLSYAATLPVQNVHIINNLLWNIIKFCLYIFQYFDNVCKPSWSHNKIAFVTSWHMQNANKLLLAANCVWYFILQWKRQGYSYRNVAIIGSRCMWVYIHICMCVRVS